MMPLHSRHACINPSGFCGRDHHYSTSPTASRARFMYLFNTPVTLSSIDVDQHTNGINCLKVTLDGKNVGDLALTATSVVALSTPSAASVASRTASTTRCLVATW